METNESQVKSENVTRKGLHKFFHVSRLDTYISVLGAFIFLGIVARMYYRFFEECYENKYR